MLVATNRVNTMKPFVLFAWTWISLLAAHCYGSKVYLRHGREQQKRQEEERRLMTEPCLVLLEHKQYSRTSEESRVMCQVNVGGSSMGGSSTATRLVHVDAFDEQWVSDNGVVSGETTLYAESATIGGGVMTIQDPDDVELTDTIGAKAPHGQQQDEDAYEDGNNMFDHSGSNRGLMQRQLFRTSGEKSVLVVRVISDDARTTSNAATLSDKVFGTFGDNVNLKSQMDSCSYGRLNFVPADDTNRIKNGVITVRINMRSKGVDDGRIKDAVVRQVEADLGINDLAAEYNHVMLCLPPGTGTRNWIAYAYINWYLSVYNDGWCETLTGPMHEIGHNIGLSHSGEGNNQYADQSGIMGFSYYQDDGPLMCFNAAKSWQLGWYTTGQKLINPAHQANTWDFTLVGISEFAKTLGFASLGYTVIVKMEGDNKWDYYMNFNRKSGQNAGTKEAPDRVLITRREKGTGYSNSLLVAKLEPEQTYSVGIGSRQMKVTFHKISYGLANVRALVTVKSS